MKRRTSWAGRQLCKLGLHEDCQIRRADGVLLAVLCFRCPVVRWVQPTHCYDYDEPAEELWTVSNPSFSKRPHSPRFPTPPFARVPGIILHVCPGEIRCIVADGVLIQKGAECQGR